jgi:hypothetical protein
MQYGRERRQLKQLVFAGFPSFALMQAVRWTSCSLDWLSEKPWYAIYYLPIDVVSSNWCQA